jgi:hypothetical protein
MCQRQRDDMVILAYIRNHIISACKVMAGYV